MAELFLKVGAQAGQNGYQDGDILEAFNDRRIACVHLEHIYREQMRAQGNPDLSIGVKGQMRPIDLIAMSWLDETYQYRFEQVSATEVKRINTLTDEEEIFGPGQMDVQLFIKRRLQHPTHRIFDDGAGNAIWHGGRIDTKQNVLDKVWTTVETHSPRVCTDHIYKRWPAGKRDLKVHLGIVTDDFVDSIANNLRSPDVDDTDPDNPITYAKRKHNVNWQSDLGLTGREIADVKNTNKTIDWRGVPEDPQDNRELKQFARAAIAQIKARNLV